MLNKLEDLTPKEIGVKLPPKIERKFSTIGAECLYVISQLNHCFWIAEDRSRCLKYSERLAKLLQKADPHRETMHGAEGRALLAAIDGNWKKCLISKHFEIRARIFLMKKDIGKKIKLMSSFLFVHTVEEFLLFAFNANAMEVGVKLIRDLCRLSLVTPKYKHRLTKLVGHQFLLAVPPLKKTRRTQLLIKLPSLKYP